MPAAAAGEVINSTCASSGSNAGSYGGANGNYIGKGAHSSELVADQSALALL